MAATLVLRNLVMMLREKGKVLENTQRRLRHKDKECVLRVRFVSGG